MLKLRASAFGCGKTYSSRLSTLDVMGRRWRRASCRPARPRCLNERDQRIAGITRALASQAILPASGMRSGRLLVRLAVPVGPHYLPGIVWVHEWTFRDSSTRIAVSCLDQACPLALACLCFPEFGRRSSPDHGQLARGVTTSRSSLIPVTPPLCSVDDQLQPHGCRHTSMPAVWRERVETKPR